MIATIPSAVLIGVDGKHVSVEVHVSNGLPGFTVVGLPDAAVRESRDRVRAALLSSGLPWPLRRTIADLDGADDLADLHVHEALLLRCRRDLLLGRERQ